MPARIIVLIGPAPVQHETRRDQESGIATTLITAVRQL